MNPDIAATLLTLKLATVTTIILMAIGPVIAWWLAQKNNVFSVVVEAVVALPLVLPPTVLGFYFLIVFSPNHAFGQAYMQLFGKPLTFSFEGLVIASVLYSLPFVVQPMLAAFKQIDKSLLEQCKLLNMGRVEKYLRIILPLNGPSLLVAALLCFAHTVGEFGVVLMIGGNIAGETRVLSIALFDHVESLNYAEAHKLALGLLVFSGVVLGVVYGWAAKRQQGVLCN